MIDENFIAMPKRLRYAVLKGHEVVPVEDVLEWARCFEQDNRIVCRSEIDGVTVSTVFLGFNHAFHGGDAPLWFETMIFGGEHDGFQTRAGTWQEAEECHKFTCKMVGFKQ